MIPRWLELARNQIGTKEWPGAATNPIVAQYYAEASGARQPDSVPWCAAFVGSMLKRAGVKPSGSLMARSYLNWGTRLDRPVPGAIVVFSRRGFAGAGHVAFVESYANGVLTIVGGNQNDAVTRATRGTGAVLGYRWPLEAKALKGGAMAMTPQEIMTAANELYQGVDTTMTIGGVRKQAKTAASLIFQLAKLHLSPSEAKGLKGPRPPRARKKPARKRK